MSIEEKFKRATDYVSSLPKDGPVQPSNDTKLKFYSNFKQASIGDCNTNQPGFMDFTGKAKWNAWNGLKGLSKEEAMKNYINALIEVLDSSDKNPEAEEVLKALKA